MIAIKNPDFFTEKIFYKWKRLNEKINSFSEIDFILSVNNVKELVKDEKEKNLFFKMH